MKIFLRFVAYLWICALIIVAAALCTPFLVGAFVALSCILGVAAITVALALPVCPAFREKLSEPKPVSSPTGESLLRDARKRIRDRAQRRGERR